MKFDCIIMNPPYQRGLHLKILNEVTKHITENGKVVSLQPISKWQEAKLFHKAMPVESMNVCTRISMDEAKTLFGTNQRCELGILANAASDIQVLDNAKFLDKIWKKLDAICDITLKSKLEDNDLDFPVSFLIGCTIAGHCGHNKACWRITSYSKETACRSGKIGHSMRFNAKNKIEQHLVWKFYQNPIMRFIYKEFGFGGAPYSIIPFIDQFKDVNGKTPLDYEWTTFDLCKFFDIDAREFEEIVVSSLSDFLYDDEQKVIEETMEKYK